MDLATKIKDARRDQWSRPVVDVVQLDLPYPVSTNALWMRSSTTGQVIRSPRYAKWFQAAGNELAIQRPGCIRGKYSLEVLIERKSGRRDIDNVLKATFDSLTHAGVWGDDSQVDRLHIQRGDVVKDGRLLVTVQVIPELEKLAA